MLSWNWIKLTLDNANLLFLSDYLYSVTDSPPITWVEYLHKLWRVTQCLL